MNHNQDYNTPTSFGQAQNPSAASQEEVSHPTPPLNHIGVLGTPGAQESPWVLGDEIIYLPNVEMSADQRELAQQYLYLANGGMSLGSNDHDDNMVLGNSLHAQHDNNALGNDSPPPLNQPDADEEPLFEEDDEDKENQPPDLSTFGGLLPQPRHHIGRVTRHMPTPDSPSGNRHEYEQDVQHPSPSQRMTSASDASAGQLAPNVAESNQHFDEARPSNQVEQSVNGQWYEIDEQRADRYFNTVVDGSNNVWPDDIKDADDYLIIVGQREYKLKKKLREPGNAGAMPSPSEQ